MHGAADAVADKVAHHAEALGLAELLHRGRDVAEPAADLRGPDGGLERLPGGAQEALGVGGDLRRRRR